MPEPGLPSGCFGQVRSSWAAETENRVQLECVRRDAGLAVVKVEEGHPGHLCPRAEADMTPRETHLPASYRSRPSDAVPAAQALPLLDA